MWAPSPTQPKQSKAQRICLFLKLVWAGISDVCYVLKSGSAFSIYSLSHPGRGPGAASGTNDSRRMSGRSSHPNATGGKYEWGCGTRATVVTMLNEGVDPYLERKGVTPFWFGVRWSEHDSVSPTA